MRTVQRENRRTTRVFDERTAIAAFLKKFPRKPPAVSREPGDKNLEKAYTELMVAGDRDDGKGMHRAKEKIAFLEQQPTVLQIALHVPEHQIFPDDFSNNTPWEVPEEPKGKTITEVIAAGPNAVEILFSDIEGPLFPKEFSNATPWAPPEKPKAKKKNVESKQ